MKTGIPLYSSKKDVQAQGEIQEKEIHVDVFVILPTSASFLCYQNSKINLIS